MSLTAYDLLINPLIRDSFYDSIPRPFRSFISSNFKKKIYRVQKLRKARQFEKVKQEKDFFKWGDSIIAVLNEYEALKDKAAFNSDDLTKRAAWYANKAMDIQNDLSAHFVGINENSSAEDKRGALAALALVYKNIRSLTLNGFKQQFKGLDISLNVKALDWDKFESSEDYQADILSHCLKALEIDYWYKKLEKTYSRLSEEMAIKIGLVTKQKPYVSDFSLMEVTAKDKKNMDFLSGFEMVRDDGESFPLNAVIEHSLANPANRHAQLMARIAGVEKLAKSEGLSADFYTMTAPSKYHKTRTRKSKNLKTGKFNYHLEDNPKYKGFTPNQTREYLQGVWARVRAKLKRDGVEFYAVRVAEAHKDGCPHWHLMVWAGKNDLVQIREVFARYALEEDYEELLHNGLLLTKPDKWQAKKGVVFSTPRLDVKEIDYAKGSATGYLLKYISKNIKSFNEYSKLSKADKETQYIKEAVLKRDNARLETLQKDEHGEVRTDKKGEVLQDSGDRVSAWARTHRIRQFQFVGDAPTAVWQEARRMSDELIEKFDLKLTKRAKQLIDICRGGDWCEYVKFMRNHNVQIEKRIIRKEESRFFNKNYEITGLYIAHKNEVMELVELRAEIGRPMFEAGFLCVDIEAVERAERVVEAQRLTTRFYTWTKRVLPPDKAEQSVAA